MSEQIRVTVLSKEDRNEAELFHDRDSTLLHTMREGGIVLPSLCDGLGKCGGCRVRFCGYAPFPTQADRAVLSPGELRDGYRLACTARPGKDCKVETAFPGERKTEILTAGNIADVPAGREVKKNGKNQKTAVIADIGTTTIAMQLVETGSGSVLDTYTCMNPQRIYGMDVIARIHAGTEGHGEKLQKLVRDALANGIEKMMEHTEGGVIGKPECMFLSANTAMGHLFMGYPVESLGKSPFTPVTIKAVRSDWLGMSTMLLPGISVFVGGDIVSGLYACGLWQENGKWLFLDLGTNAEMAMGKGGRIVCTAAAAGPAFEGRSSDGATGAERILAIASLLEQGIIDETGLMAEPYFETGIDTVIKGKGKQDVRVRIRQEDVRDIQMAKAAVRAGIQFLMRRLEVQEYEEIERIYIAGGLGFYLDRKAAVRIGLIPAEWEKKTEAAGNTSLAGIRLLAGKGRKEDSGTGETAYLEVLDELEGFAGKAEAFQLAGEPGFDKVYIDCMHFNKCKHFSKREETG